MVPGIIKTTVGYTGGPSRYPTYSSVCGGDGHSEAVRVEFDPDEISYDKLVDIFFANHSPTPFQLAQYKSIIFTADDEQETSAWDAVRSRGAVNTTVRREREWWDAEENHQKYVAKQEEMFRNLAAKQEALKKAAARKAVMATKRAKQENIRKPIDTTLAEPQQKTAAQTVADQVEALSKDPAMLDRNQFVQCDVAQPAEKRKRNVVSL